LILVVGEISGAVSHTDRTAAVFVDSRARIQRGGIDVRGRAVCVPTDENGASPFARSAFEPIDIVAVEQHIENADRVLHNQV
jgi:hypothetical protein